jgi:hypothetical protein
MDQALLEQTEGADNLLSLLLMDLTKEQGQVLPVNFPFHPACCLDPLKFASSDPLPEKT